jgi:excisionase family DNA binding protein
MNEVLGHTVHEATRISGASRTTIYAEISAGRLQARKLGRRTVILDADLRQWLASLPVMKSSAA